MIVLGVLVLVFLVLSIAFGFASYRSLDQVLEGASLVATIVTVGLSISLAIVAIALG